MQVLFVQGIFIFAQKPQRSLDDSQIYPWRHREVLTLDIPVHDTEKAGLGVSVKGKTSATHGTPSQLTVDLGQYRAI